MMGRVRGFVLIVNTVLPFLIVVGLSTLAWQTATNIEHAWVGTCDRKGQPSGCLKGIAPALNDMVVRNRASVQKTQAAVQKSKAKVSAAFTKLGNAKDKVDGIVKAVAKPLAVVEKIKVAKIGEKVTKPFRSMMEAVSSLAAPFKDLKAAAAEMAKLEALQGQMKAMQRDLSDAAARVLELAKPMGSMARMIAWFSVILAFWLGFSYVVWAYGRLVTGIALIRG